VPIEEEEECLQYQNVTKKENAVNKMYVHKLVKMSVILVCSMGSEILQF
jgi:hypothetical protein